jgi:hypothetical protein
LNDSSCSLASSLASSSSPGPRSAPLRTSMRLGSTSGPAAARCFGLVKRTRRRRATGLTEAGAAVVGADPARTGMPIMVDALPRMGETSMWLVVKSTSFVLSAAGMRLFLSRLFTLMYMPEYMSSPSPSTLDPSAPLMAMRRISLGIHRGAAFSPFAGANACGKRTSPPGRCCSFSSFRWTMAADGSPTLFAVASRVGLENMVPPLAGARGRGEGASRREGTRFARRAAAVTGPVVQGAACSRLIRKHTF